MHRLQSVAIQRGPSATVFDNPRQAQGVHHAVGLDGPHGTTCGTRCAPVRALQYDFGSPRAFSATKLRMSCGETGAIRGSIASRNQRSTWYSRE